MNRYWAYIRRLGTSATKRAWFLAMVFFKIFFKSSHPLSTSVILPMVSREHFALCMRLWLKQWACAFFKKWLWLVTKASNRRRGCTHVEP